MKEALALGAAQQLEEICDWLATGLAGPAIAELLRREFEVSDPMPAREDELVTALEASAHNCRQAGEGIQAVLKEIRHKRGA